MRRLMLLALALMVGAMPAAAASDPDNGAMPSATVPDPELDAKVRAAFLLAFPVYQIARTRADAIADANAAGRSVVNRFGHRPRLAGPQDRKVTTPNNDTLYSAAWLDLSAGPVVLEMPPLPDRYHSVALMDVFTDNFAVLGSRANGGRGGRFLLTGPGWRGRVPAGMKRIAAPGNDVWALVRVLVDGPEDLAAAAAAQSRFSVAPLSGNQAMAEAGPRLPHAPDPQLFLLVANRLIARTDLSPARAASAARLVGVGIDTAGDDHWETLSPAVRESWNRQLPTLVAELRGGMARVGTIARGWSYPRPGMGRYGSDDSYRATVALGGLGALPAEEAVYFTATTDADGASLDGRQRYTLTLPANLPRAAFWSLSMYEVAQDGRLFFAVNPLNRYAIGNRTRGLTHNRDGSVTIVLSEAQPHAGSGNWLPAPAGPFTLTFRAYIPSPLYASTYLPGIIRHHEPGAAYP